MICILAVLTIALFTSAAVAKNITIKAIKAGAGGSLESVERTEIPYFGGVIAHYTATLIVGGGLSVPIDPENGLPIWEEAGSYVDTIRIHRVVKESSPGIPDPTVAGILCSHGDLGDFNFVYMPSIIVPHKNKGPEDSFGCFLAMNGLDVWGIDWRWATIPVEEAPVQLRWPRGSNPKAPPFLGLNYMDTDTHLDDFELTLKVARHVRKCTGSGFDKMYVTGWSRGAYMVVALANRLANINKQAAKGFPHIKGIIPVDFPIKTDDPDVQELSCAQALAYDSIIAGNGGAFPPFNDPNLVPPFFNPVGLVFSQTAYLAMSEPEGDSQIFPPEFGLSNKNVYDIFIGATWFPMSLFAGESQKWHFNAVAPITSVELDSLYPFPVPVVSPNTDTLYTDYDYMNQLSLFVSPYQSYGEQQDSMVCLCDDPEIGDSPHDDYLDLVDIPVLYVGADGSFAHYADALLQRLGGDDKEKLIVTGTYPYYDTSGYGHADLYFGEDADEDFWLPMLQWILDRG
jgi:hypothetical protein